MAVGLPSDLYTHTVGHPSLHTHTGHTGLGTRAILEVEVHLTSHCCLTFQQHITTTFGVTFPLLNVVLPQSPKIINITALLNVQSRGKSAVFSIKYAGGGDHHFYCTIWTNKTNRWQRKTPQSDSNAPHEAAALAFKSDL